MNLIRLLFVALSLVIAPAILHADDAAKRTNLTAEEQEQISRIALRLSQTQLQIIQLQNAAKDLEQQLTTTEQQLAAKHNATGCSLSIDKEWSNCPAAPSTKK